MPACLVPTTMYSHDDDVMGSSRNSEEGRGESMPTAGKRCAMSSLMGLLLETPLYDASVRRSLGERDASEVFVPARAGGSKNNPSTVEAVQNMSCSSHGTYL